MWILLMIPIIWPNLFGNSNPSTTATAPANTLSAAKDLINLIKGSKTKHPHSPQPLSPTQAPVPKIISLAPESVLSGTVWMSW